MSRKLIILAILLCFPAILFAKPPEDRIKEKDVVGVKTEVYYQKAKEAGVVTEVAGVVKIKPADWKDVKIKDRIDLRILDEVGTETQQAVKIADKTEDDTTLAVKVALIVDEEVSADVHDFAETIKPIDVGYQAREMNKVFLSVQESEKLKSGLRLIPSKQYPVIAFPFLELTNDDSSIYYIDTSKWVDIAKMQVEIKGRDIKLAMLGVTIVGGSKGSNWNATELVTKTKEYEIIYQAFKEVRPDIPVGFVAVMYPNLQEWLNTFTVQPDCWLLMNVDNYEANWTKIKSRWFADKPVIANLNYGFTFSEGVEQKYEGWKEASNTLQALGYAGSIYWRK